MGPEQSGPDSAPDALGHPELEAIYRLSARTADSTGGEFFVSLVQQLASVLDVRGAFVSVFTEDLEFMRMVAMWDGQHLMTDHRYAMGNTPCREVAKGRIFHCPRGVRTRFPEDPHLAAMKAESYRGVPLVGPSGWHMGHLAVVDTRPIEEEPRFFALMRLFSVRAAAELDRMQAAQALEASEHRLSAVLQSTHDGIVHLDEQGTVTLFNAAAERMFGCPAQDATGQSFDRFLSVSLRRRLGDFRAIHVRGGSEDGPLWLPERSTAQRSDGASFSVEGSVAARREGDRVGFTLVLRDIDERVATQRRIDQLSRDNAVLAEQLREAHSEIVVGDSPVMRSVLDLVEQVAPTNATVLILGESGTGKEMIARALHAASSRRDRPMVRVNCAALPGSLIESELFGHEKGSFTGAAATRLGRFEVAHRGTLLLDEIGELPLTLQPKLLRVLQEQELERVGSSNTRKVDVRIIAATNRDLLTRVQQGEFRDDLYYRLMGFPLQLPALRERPEDVEPLAVAFMRRYARQIGRSVERIEAPALARLRAYPWPGNVRELQSVIERAVILSRGPVLAVDASLAMVPSANPVPLAARPTAEIPLEAAGQNTPGIPTRADEPEPGELLSMREVERRHIEHVLAQTGWVIDGPRGAAKQLEINASTLRSRMRKLGIERPS